MSSALSSRPWIDVKCVFRAWAPSRTGRRPHSCVSGAMRPIIKPLTWFWLTTTQQSLGKIKTYNPEGIDLSSESLLTDQYILVCENSGFTSKSLHWCHPIVSNWKMWQTQKFKDQLLWKPYLASRAAVPRMWLPEPLESRWTPGDFAKALSRTSKVKTIFS